MSRPWVPRASEIVLIEFNPVAGHEQGKARPAVILSPQGFNDRAGLVVCVAVTSQVKGNPFEVPIAGLDKPSVALSHQVRTLDWRARQARPAGFATDGEMREIRGKLGALVGTGS